ncbi:DUF1330 domain-containing protein [Sphingobium sp. JS3065]|uniref:DUF1330 domain-containing protein n=1 Tax=Sphingobium sp. JS3065 TaxID=2970925 RepID=UPI00226474C4|nr:DUF1330 domain-containing protein [Sphingobium sp. JS3065]UZW55363.1 DUF1330 domain-containing protein [Sphingobium sp. JS3065]
MPKGYWIAHITVENPEAYQLYTVGATDAFRLFGGRPLARGGRMVSLEGTTRPRNVVIEFDSLDAALRCYNSPEYQAARAHRIGNATGDIMIIEGVA